MEFLEELRSQEPSLLTTVDPTIPPDLAALVHRALAKDPARRFSDLAELRAGLERVARRSH